MEIKSTENNLKCWFRYTVGPIQYKWFEDITQARWYAFNEGDHLLDWGKVEE